MKNKIIVFLGLSILLMACSRNERKVEEKNIKNNSPLSSTLETIDVKVNNFQIDECPVSFSGVDPTEEDLGGINGTKRFERKPCRAKKKFSP